MNSLRLLLIPLVGVGMVLLSGCDVETEPQPPVSYQPANHLIINEVFTLPSSNPNAHSWVEIYNPTGQTLNLAKWSLTYKTTRYNVAALLFYTPVYDTITRITHFEISQFQQQAFPDTVAATYDVPLTRAADSILVHVIPIAGSPVDFKFADSTGAFELQPNEFCTLVSDLPRLRVFNTIGPGSGPAPVSSPLLPMRNPFFRFVTFERDSAHPRQTLPDTAYGYYYSFFLGPTDQIVLKDSTGVASDVVRYGNYVYSGVDPYPTYQTIGVVPDGESIARYAGAYDTRNTANDFYITRAGLRPIPHWISQLWKK